jgi:hypothetical protein
MNSTPMPTIDLSNSTYLPTNHSPEIRSLFFLKREGLTDDQMMQIAREMNLSETVFVLKACRRGRVLRHFEFSRPLVRFHLRGIQSLHVEWIQHAKVLFHFPKAAAAWQRIYHEVGIGVLPVDIEFKDGQPAPGVMTQGKFEVSPKSTTHRNKRR